MNDEARDIWIERIDECLRVIDSFEHFVLKHVYIEDKETSQAIPFKLWDSQTAILPKFLDSQRLVILKARQLGLTWLTAAFCLWLSITKPLQLIVVISAKEDWAKELVDRILFILHRLPTWIYPPIKRSTSEILEFEHKDQDGRPVYSTIKSLPTTEEGAQSKTPTLLVVDESALNRYFKQIFASSKPGLDVAKGRMVIISNAIKTAPGWPFTREIYQKSMRGENDFERIFMPWWDRPDRPKDFIKRQLREGMHEEDIAQHYPETEDEAISTLLGSYFGKTLAKHNKTCKGVTGNLVRNKEKELEFIPDPRGILEVWRFPYYLVQGWSGEHWARRYCGGADVSEGLGESYSVGYILDRKLDEIACRIRSNRVDAHTLGDLLHDLSEWYCNTTEWTRVGGVTSRKSELCVERTGAGQTTVKRLKDLKANQYVRMVPGKLGPGLTKEYGWNESQQSKYDLCEDLRTWFRQLKGTIYDAILIDECSTWIKHEGTMKLGPEEGHFGDCVIAAGCTIQASHFTGKSPERIKPPDVGWMARQIEKQEVKTGWMV